MCTSVPFLQKDSYCYTDDMSDIGTTLQQALTSPHHMLFLIVSARSTVYKETIDLYAKEYPKAAVYAFDTKQIHVAMVKDLQTIAAHLGTQQKVIVISFYSFLLEAQNKMLKVLEETKGTTKFIFITEKRAGILPTLFSRAEVSYLESANNSHLFATKLFLQTDPMLRNELPFVKSLLAKKDDTDKKDREHFVHFLSELLLIIPEGKEGLAIKSEILLFLSFAGDKSASPKMILDYLALSLPRMVE